MYELLRQSRNTPEHDSFLRLVRSADYIAAYVDADKFEHIVPKARCDIERFSTVAADVIACLVRVFFCWQRITDPSAVG